MNKLNINPDMKCVAIVKTTGKVCGHVATYDIEVHINQGTVRKNMIPSLEGKGWTKTTIDVCGVHYNVLCGRVDPTLQVIIQKPIKEEKEMKENDPIEGPSSFPQDYQGEEHPDPIVDQPLIKNQPFMWKTDKGIVVNWFATQREALEFCKEHVNSLIRKATNGHGWNVFPTMKPYGDKREDNAKKLDKKVLCGKCKEYHNSVQEVKDCYTTGGK